MTVTAGQVAVKLNLDKKQFEAGMQEAKKSVDVLSAAFSSLAALGVGATLLNVGKSALKASSDFEQANVQFGVMLGSAEKATKLVDKLQKMANVTPFETQDLLDASKVLLNFGTDLEEILPDLQMLGDIAGGNRDKMRSMTLAFAQMSSAGRLMGQDLLQMINAGFNPLQVISEKTGKSMAQLKDEMGEGKISVDMVKQAFRDATSEGGRFYGMMNKQSETLEGRLSTMNDAYTLMIRSISDAALPALKKQVEEVTKLIEKTNEGITSFKKWADVHNQTTNAITNTGLALAATVTGSIALAKIIPQIITAQKAAVAATVAEVTAQEALNYAKKVAAAEEIGLYQATLAYNQALATENTQLIASASANLNEAKAAHAAAIAKVEATNAAVANTKATAAQCLMAGKLTKAIRLAAIEVRAFTVALLSNPITWVAAAIGACAAAVFNYKNNVEKATAAIKDFNNAQNQSIDETEEAIKTLSELKDVVKKDDEQYRKYTDAVTTLTTKYPQFASEIENEIKLQGRLSEELAKKIALMETEMQLKQIDAEIDKNANFRKGFHPISNFKYSISLGKMNEYELADQNLEKLYKEKEEVIKRYQTKIQTLLNIGNKEESAALSNNTAATGSKDKKAEKDAKAAAKEALEYKLALLDVERYQKERNEEEIYQIELQKINLRLAAAKEGTSEHAQILADRLQLERNHERNLRDLKSSKLIDDLSFNKQELDNKLAYMQIEYDSGRISQEKMLMFEREVIAEKKMLEETALKERLKLIEGNTAEEVKLKREAQRVIEEYNIQERQKERELWNYRRSELKTFKDSVSSTLGSTFAGLLNGEASFAQAANSLLNGVLNHFGDMCGDMVTRWVADHLTMQSVTETFSGMKLMWDNLLGISNKKRIAENTALAASEIATAQTTAVASAETAAATTGMAAGVTALLAPITALSVAMAGLALSSTAVAANMGIIAVSTGLFSLEAALASLTSTLLSVSFGVLAVTSKLAAKGVASLAVANAANSAAMIPLIGWTMAPGAALATGASIAAADALVQFREKGGEVKKGQPYIVGEKRPELFIPDRNGRIEPNLNSLMGGNSGGDSYTDYNMPVTMIVNSNDAKSFESRIDDLTDRIHSNLLKKIQRRKLASLGG